MDVVSGTSWAFQIQTQLSMRFHAMRCKTRVSQVVGRSSRFGLEEQPPSNSQCDLSPPSCSIRLHMSVSSARIAAIATSTSPVHWKADGKTSSAHG